MEVIGTNQSLLEVVTVVFTIVIAVAGAIITHGQLRLAKESARRELFDDRLAVFLATKNFISDVLVDGKVTDDEIRAFTLSTKGAYFLFGDDISGLMNQLYTNAMVFRSIRNRQDGNNQTEKKIDYLNDKSERLRTWFGNHEQWLESNFGIYIRVNDL